MGVTSIDKTRIGGSKVRTGCRTCKARRVKCSEEKPNCLRCVKAGRKCEGYSPTPSPDLVPAGHKFVHYVCPPGVGNPVQTPAVHGELDLNAIRALEFYHNFTVLQLEQTFSYDLWSKTLSRLMQSEPAIKHGVVALATLHENFVYPPQSGIEDQRRMLALEHYGKSIQSVVRVNEKNAGDAVLTTLISCLLYCAIESIQSHVPSARKHINAGIGLLAEHENKLLEREGHGGGISSGFMDTLRQIFVSLGTQSVALEDTSIDDSLIRYLQTSEGVTDYNFTSTTQALTAISHIMNDCMQFITWVDRYQKCAQYCSEELHIAGEILQQRFDNWERAYSDLLANTTSLPSKCQLSKKMEVQVLRINELLCRIILSIRFIEDQSGFDSCLDEFQRVVQAAEEMLQIESQKATKKRQRASLSYRLNPDDPIFSLTLGVVPGLFFTATRCRDSETRHRALELLRHCRRRESVWDSQVCHEMAERIVTLEEQRAREYWEMHSHDGENTPSSGTAYDQPDLESRSPCNYTVVDLPEQVRIHTINITYSTTQNRARVSLLEQGHIERHVEHFEWRE